MKLTWLVDNSVKWILSGLRHLLTYPMALAASK